MYLNHLDLQVPDVPATALFFERHFGFTIRGNRSSPAIVILSGDGGFTLVLQRRADGERYPEGFHCGFIVADDATVRAERARLLGAGVACSDLAVSGRGTVFYVRAPGDLTVEVSCRPAPATAR